MSIKKIRNGATYFFALSIFSLAGAIVYFSVQIVNVATEMPDLLASIDKVNDNISPVMREITEIRKQVPAILKEISETRKQIPPILDEVKKVREQVPPILEEVKATRKAIPSMLTQGAELVADASTIGEKAGKGAVKGFFKGIVTAPFRLIRGMGKTLFSVGGKAEEKLSEDDLKQLDLIGSEILASETIGETRDWKNEEQGLTGKLTLLAIGLTDNKTCKKLQIQLWHNKKSILDKISTMCLDRKGGWSEQDNLSPEYD